MVRTWTYLYLTFILTDFADCWETADSKNRRKWVYLSRRCRYIINLYKQPAAKSSKVVKVIYVSLRWERRWNKSQRGKPSCLTASLKSGGFQQRSSGEPPPPSEKDILQRNAWMTAACGWKAGVSQQVSDACRAEDTRADRKSFVWAEQANS